MSKTKRQIAEIAVELLRSVESKIDIMLLINGEAIGRTSKENAGRIDLPDAMGLSFPAISTKQKTKVRL